MRWFVRFAVSSAPADPEAAPIDVFEVHGPFISHLWELGTTGVAHHRRPDAEAGDEELTAGFDDLEAATRAEAVGRHHGFASRLESAIDEWIDGSTSRVEVNTERGPVNFPIMAEAAFGHGGHPTTRLAVEMMERAGVGAQRLLDLGTGSGVLAIAAHHLGATSIVAIDHDPRAVATAERNVAANGVAATCLNLTADELGAAFDDRFDVVVANVLVTVHEEFAPNVDTVVTPSGRLLVTGFLDEQRDRVVQAYRASLPLLSVSDELVAGDWRGLILTVQQPAGISRPDAR